MSTPAPTAERKPARSESCRVVVGSTTRRHQIGVATDPAEPREVLRRRRYPCRVHPRHERGGVPGDHRRVGAVAATQHPDRLVHLGQLRRYDVGHRSEIRVDPRRAQLGAPLFRRRTQSVCRPAALGPRRRDVGEAGTLQPLNQAPLLVGGQHRPHAGRAPGRGADLPDQSPDAGPARVGGAEQDDAAGPAAGQRPRGGRRQSTRRYADHEQLPDLLASAQPADQLRAGRRARGDCGRSGGRPRGGRRTTSGSARPSRGRLPRSVRSSIRRWSAPG